MKKAILIISLVAMLFCVATQVRAADQADNQSLLIQLQQQISKLSQQIAQIFSTQTAAVSATSNCTDSDSGRDYFAKGTITYTYAGQDRTATDYCIDNTKVTEYFCDTGSAFGTTKICENGCQDGACKTASTPTTPAGSSCTDTDSGRDYLTAGSVTAGNVTYPDVCSDSSLLEYYCSGSSMANEWKNCDNGCQNGACVKPAVCTPNWKVGDWSVCVNNIQTRTVTDLNQCGVMDNTMPTTAQSCSFCTPNWQIGAWGVCINGQQTRTVTDSNQCGATTGKPADTQTCVNTCTPSWQIGAWGVCINGQQTRTVTDANQCGTIIGKPADTQTCTVGVCTDSDSGKDYSTKGTVSYSGQNYVDYCYTANLAWLGEFYCENNIEKFEWHMCSSGCQDGACKAAPSCTSNWQTGAWGACVNGQQTRTVTDSNQCGVVAGKPAETQACTSNACTDSDNGKTYSTKGTVVSGGQSYVDYCYTANPAWLAEYYCDSNTGKYEWYQCPNGCQDGACKATPACTPNWQTGAWSACVNGQQTRTVTDSNQCGITTGKPAETQTCSICTPNWQTGAWGVCINGQQTRTVTDSNQCGVVAGKPAETQACTLNACTDSDNGKDYFIKGTASGSNSASSADYCASATRLVEYYCQAGSAIVFAETKDCDAGCQDGACKAVINNQTCTETDAGKDYYTKGVTTNAENLSSTDSCNGNWLSEYYCDGIYTKVDYSNCANGCDNGACKVASGSSCSDTDNGKDYYTKGILLSGGNTMIDSCTSGYLTEYYCTTSAAGGYAAENKKCNYGCGDGVCLQGVTFSSPVTSANTYLNKGEKYEIKWQSDGLEGKFVQIFLYNFDLSGNKTLVKVLGTVDTVVSGNYFSWTISSDIPVTANSNEKYKIAIIDAAKASSSNGVLYYSMPFSIIVKASCTDSDNGISYFTKGTLIYTDTAGAVTTVTDKCTDANNLTEYYCDSSGVTNYLISYLRCTGGCQDGVCICTPNWTCTSWSACSSGQQTRTCTDTSNCGVSANKPAESQSCSTASCTDSDGGRNFGTKGTINYVYNGNNLTATDYCNGTKNLVEYSCTSTGSGFGESKTCSNICSNGACK